MKLKYKINLASLGILITVACAIAGAGVFALNQVTYDLNNKLMTKEVDNLITDISTAQQVLLQSGVASVESYSTRAKKDLLDEFRQYSFGRTGKVLIVETDGKVLLTGYCGADEVVQRSFLGTMVELGKGSLEHECGGESRFFSFALYPEWNWLIMISVTTKEMLEGRSRFLQNVMIILQVTLLLGSMLFVWFSSRIIRPIRQLATAAQAVSRGEWDLSLPVSKSKDEVSQLTAAFKDMSEKLAANYSNLNENLEEVARSEEALSAEKEQLAITLRSIGDGVITTNVKGCIALINKVAEELTGWTQEEALDKSLDRVFHIINEKSRKRRENSVLAIIQSGHTEELSGQTVLLAKDGSERIISASGAPIHDSNGVPAGVILVFRDITEKVKMQEELLKAHKLESVGVLAGGIAHDFNNILTAILGNLSLAKMQANPGDAIFANLEETEKASLRAKNLTQQLLTFSKGGEPIKKTTSLLEVIRESALFALTGSKNSCEFHFEENIWPVEADDGQIGQVIHNLIINASQAMNDGGTIHVFTKNLMSTAHLSTVVNEGKYIEITINDPGKGIPKESLPYIFDPYYTTKQMGSGLGLASAYSIIKKHNGYISVESEQGEGTTFFIYLPASEKSISPTEFMKEAILVGSGKILVMDDEEIVRTVTGVMLDSLGYDSEFAKDGQEAITLYRKAMEDHTPYDAVIMDLTVPGGMGGLDAVAQLLEIDPNVKAIVSSGYANNPIMANFKRYGFVAVVSKPYSIVPLSKTLHEVIGAGGDQ